MRSKYWLIVVLTVVGLVASARTASATPLTFYQVSVVTAGLGGGLFGLDFQLNDGDGISGNSDVTLSNFNFGTGSASGSPALSGGASGDTTVGASITDSSFFNQFLQNFNAGNTLSFTLGVGLANPGSAPTPDLFTLAIIDINGTGFEIPTTGPLGVEFLSYQFSDPAPQSYGTDPFATTFVVPAPLVVPLAPSVPEPATLLLLGTGLVGIVRARMSRRVVGK